MAHREPAVNGLRTNNPPPSTLAAQLIHNQLHQDGSQRNGSGATFAQLLHEILHNQAAVPETNVNVNAKLIHVVAEAGLSPLIQDNPFAQWDVLVPQAERSIEVIEATIKRQPEVLQSPVFKHGPQLCVWLVAKLAAVCGRPKCLGVPADRLLETMTSSLAASTELCQYSPIFGQVLRDCVDDAIACLERESTELFPFTLLLPPARSIPKLWRQAESTIVLPPNCHTTVRGANHAFAFAVYVSTLESLAGPWAQESQVRLCKIFSHERAIFNKHDSVQPLIYILLTKGCVKAKVTLVQQMLQDETLGQDPPSPIEETLTQCLRRDIEQGAHGDFDGLLAAVKAAAEPQKLPKLSDNLRVAVGAWISRFFPEGRIEKGANGRTNGQENALVSEHNSSKTFWDLDASDKKRFPVCRGRKRKRGREALSTEFHRPVSVLTQLSAMFPRALQMSTIPAIEPNDLLRLPEDKQIAVWHCLADLAAEQLHIAIPTVTALAQESVLKQNKTARILSIIAIRQCVLRSKDEQVLDLVSSDFGQICLRSLQSTVRELRMAAIRAITAFLRPGIADAIRERNLKVTLEVLHSISERDILSEHETVIAAWGQVALICEGQELNIVLINLIKYLGHGNPLVCGLAFEELLSVASAKALSVEELFRPFWRTIAVSVVQDIHTKPQKIQQMCNLLSIDVNKFLLNTQRETLPVLVLTKRRDIIQRIASARSPNTPLQDVIMQPKTNLAAILGFLNCQSNRDIEEAVMDCLASVAPGFNGIDLSTLVKIEPVLIACEMLKIAAEQDESKKSRTYQAIQVFANLAEREPGRKKAHSNLSRTMADFFEKHVLGILNHYTAVLENASAIHPVTEKAACLQGISEMIVLAKSHAAIALPQIRACLQSAINQRELCEIAFNGWLTLLGVLGDEDFQSIIDQTFALIVRYWSCFSSDMHRRIHDSIENLIAQHNSIIRDNISTLPSLVGIPLLSKFAGEFERIKATGDVETQCAAFARRLQDESSTVVFQALKELMTFLEEHQEFTLTLAVSEQPGEVLRSLIRALLDTTIKYAHVDDEAAVLCAKCLGVLGCVDPYRIDATKKKRRVLMLSNFEKATEVVDWACTLFEDVFINAFRSVTNARAQGFLAYVMQELLRFCGFNEGGPVHLRSSQGNPALKRWREMPENIRITLTPFLTSRYVVTSNANTSPPNRTYPGFSPDTAHSSWLRGLVFDLTWKAKGDNAKMVFPLLARIIKGHDIAIATFLMPYALLNVILGGTVAEVSGIQQEMLAILRCVPETISQQETIRLCSESVFAVLDYLSTWLQEKRKALSETRAAAYRTGQSPEGFDELKNMHQLECIDKFLASIPAEVIASRALDCGSYARALFHWEKFIRQHRRLIPSTISTTDETVLYDKLQEIYAQIDEPDGLEGIAAHMFIVSEEQQATQNARAGRWTAAQAWYETQIAGRPSESDIETRVRLLHCLRVTGQYATLLRYADSFSVACQNSETCTQLLQPVYPLVAEAAWLSGDVNRLQMFSNQRTDKQIPHFNVGLAKLLCCYHERDLTSFGDWLTFLRTQVAQSIASGVGSSLQACHIDLRRLHVLYEVEALATSTQPQTDAIPLFNVFAKRLAVIGSHMIDKQYVLGVRRAIMQIKDEAGLRSRIGAAWLTTARLARKAGNTAAAYDAVLKATECGDRAAKLEEAKLLWHEGHNRQAIQVLEAGIESGLLNTSEAMPLDQSGTSDVSRQENMVSARAHLLLAKWLDASGQSQSREMNVRYQYAAKTFQRWEKGHYHLAKHYVKMLEAEKALPRAKQNSSLHTGEMAKLCVENLLRSAPFGTKYWHHSLPKLFTLWLDLGLECMQKAAREDAATFEKRCKQLHQCNNQFAKYSGRVPPYVFWSAMPQIISRISHPHPEVWKALRALLTRIGAAYPSQALWSLLAIAKARDPTRAARGVEIINRLKDPKKRPGQSDSSGIDLRVMITQGQKLCDGLLQASEARVDSSSSKVNFRDLGFNTKLAPIQLVVPVESNLVPNIPQGANAERIRKHRPFAQEKVTIHSFEEEVLVLNSLQRPKKITLRGSDGKKYSLLCKPKDDLRKDQRLMEFNTSINRAFKLDEESSKRRLYIKTYAVTPLSEESGILEWVEGIKPIRDILLNLYSRKSIKPNYNEIRAILNEACSHKDNVHLFVDKVLGLFKPLLHEWFTETFPDPVAWFAARLRYARSAAVMSMAGHVLGLGDRHGENILLQEGTGGVLHVDFNCLFDKGLTFEKPEVVPFRLTHNMVDAMGPYGYDGPFRRSCELTLGLLRQNKDTLMTMLETFLHDPTTDFIGKKKRSIAGVPETPQEILESVDGKLKGLMKGESVPLGVQGYVDALIREAVNPWNLCQMYIGWCAFL